MNVEELAVEVLKRESEPLLITEIVEKIRKLDSSKLKGKTPSKSFYSVIYRNESKREKQGDKLLFKKSQRGKQLYLELNK